VQLSDFRRPVKAQIVPEGPVIPSDRPLHSERLLLLPFVTRPSAPEHYEDWGQFWKHAIMWNDEPTGSHLDDYARGRDYAREAIKAIVDDDAIPRGLQQVVEAIIERGFSRRGPSGRLCRQLSSAERSFLRELCTIAVEASKVVVSNPQAC
jgi:hypothetical protein